MFSCTEFRGLDVLLTVHLSIILVIDKLNLFPANVEHMVSS